MKEVAFIQRRTLDSFYSFQRLKSLSVLLLLWMNTKIISLCSWLIKSHSLKSKWQLAPWSDWYIFFAEKKTNNNLFTFEKMWATVHSLTDTLQTKFRYHLLWFWKAWWFFFICASAAFGPSSYVCRSECERDVASQAGWMSASKSSTLLTLSPLATDSWILNFVKSNWCSWKLSAKKKLHRIDNYKYYLSSSHLLFIVDGKANECCWAFS